MMRRKNLFILTAILVATPLCLAQMISAAKSKPQGNDIDQLIIAKSREVWEAYQTRNIAQIKSLSVKEYEAFTQTGPSNLQEDIANIEKLTITSYTIDQPKVFRVTKDVAILRYKCDLKGSFDGKPFVPVYATEVWVNRGGKWQIVSYQETAVI